MPGSAADEAARPPESATLPDDGTADPLEGASGPAAPRPPPLPRVKPAPPPLAAPTASSPTPPQKMDAAGLVGLSEAEIESLLGPPKSETLALPARIREYRDATCGVRLYLYVDLKSEKYRVLHTQPIPAGLDAGQADRCVARIARRATGAEER